jgi:hypothetical protein
MTRTHSLIETDIKEFISEYNEQHNLEIEFLEYYDGIVIANLAGMSSGQVYALMKSIIETIPEVESLETEINPEEEIPIFNHPFTHGNFEDIDLIQDDEE